MARTEASEDFDIALDAFSRWRRGNRVQIPAHMEHGLTHMHVALQAREDEVYWASYTAHEQVLALQGKEQVISIDAVPLPGPAASQGAGVGNAWAASGQLRQRITGLHQYFPDIQPSASVASVLGRQFYLSGKTGSAKDALPVYLKEQEYR